MSDWIEHNGGPQPVGDDVRVEALVATAPGFDVAVYQQQKAASVDWPHVSEYRILNQHLIAAARLEGIRLGLEAAKRHAEAVTALQSGRLVAIPSLNPDTIAKEAHND